VISLILAWIAATAGHWGSVANGVQGPIGEIGVTLPMASTSWNIWSKSSIPSLPIATLGDLIFAEVVASMLNSFVVPVILSAAVIVKVL
jgi:hypothetical protein